MSRESLVTRIAELVEATESGTWQRHASVRTSARALDGWTSAGRWGTGSGFPVLYLGRPTESVVVEAYRHHIDPVIFDSDSDRERFLDSQLPRVLVTCRVAVTRLLDLRTPLARAAAGLTPQDLASPVTDTEAYGRCQEVAAVAHQLGLHGVLAPAATGLGDTLALFTDRLPAAERPTRIPPDTQWQRLPPDPREAPPSRLRLIRGGGE